MKSQRLLVLLLALQMDGVAMATEEPSYTLVERDRSFEIRDYAPMTIAETLVRDDFDGAGNEAFGTLFGYISGKNQPKQKIAMTAPVRQETEADGSFRVGFIAPSSYTIKTAPRPDNQSVKLRELPAQRMAAVRYSGRWTEKNYREHETSLLAWVKSRGLTIAGPVVYARYNAPFVPWPLRRNEVMVPVVAENAASR
jgi:effector-binding domain-containing protein